MRNHHQVDREGSSGTEKKFPTLQSLIESRRAEKFALYEKYVNPLAVQSARRFGADRQYIKGEGAYLYDQEGRRYLDCDAGGGVFNLGRNHPHVHETIRSLLSQSPPNMIYRDTPLLAGLLAEALAQRTPGDLNKALYTNSGSEATEAAIKFARRLTGRPRLLFLEGAYHGATYGALSVSDVDLVREGFGPILPGCERIPRNDLARLRQELSRGDVAGLFLEPIQGYEILALDRDFLTGAQRLCREHDAAFIVDEVFVGFGRTGKFFACEHFGLEPDMLLLSKALSGGCVPVGALMVSDKLHARLFKRAGEFVHGSTFGHNDFGMAAGLATLQVLEAEDLVANAARQGQRLLDGLLQLKARYDMIANVRGWGLMIGIELRAPRSLISRLSGKMLEKRGLLGYMAAMQLLAKHRILSTLLDRNNAFRLSPPLIIGDEEVAYILQSIEAVLQDAYRFPDGIASFVLGQLLKMARRH